MIMEEPASSFISFGRRRNDDNRVSGRHHLYNRGCRTEWHPRMEKLKQGGATGSRYLAYIRGIVLQTIAKGIGDRSEHISLRSMYPVLDRLSEAVASSRRTKMQDQPTRRAKLKDKLK